MGQIINYVKSIGEFFVTIVDFVISFVEDIVYVIKLTGEFVLDIPEYFSWLPGEFVAIIVSVFAVVVIYKVLGREG